MMHVDYAAFEQKRLELICALEAGKLDKAEFLSKSYALFEGAIYAEPDVITSIEQGMFYYFYFNTMAKSYMKRSKGDSTGKNAYISNEYYQIKENVLISLIGLFSNEELFSYYVKTDSIKLKNNLVEIVVKSREKLIFHTLNPKTISVLKRRGLLEPRLQDSAIHSYINKKYY